METSELQYTVQEWFSNLDYEYMVLHTIVCYGLYYSNNWRWVVEWFSPVRRKGRSKAVWLFGGVFVLIEGARFLPYWGEGGLNHEKFISLFHSFVVIQVFVEPIVTRVHHWIGNKTNE